MNVIQADVGVAGIHAFTTLRAKGTSDAPFQSLNFGDHVGDDPQKVKFNRDILRDSLPGNVPPRWLQQIHGVDVVAAHSLAEGEVPVADAIWTDRPGLAVAVMTADCLPIVLAGIHSDWVAIVHAGWRGLAAGVIEATLAAVPGSFEGAQAWFGPAIGPCCFEVGAEVRATFLERFGATVQGVFHRPIARGNISRIWQGWQPCACTNWVLIRSLILDAARLAKHRISSPIAETASPGAWPPWR